MAQDLVPTRILDQDLVERRRAELVESAFELFLKQGFHGTSVREIADAVGWQMGTLYRYVRTKEDVLFLILRWINDQLTEGLDETEAWVRDQISGGFTVSAEEMFRAAATSHIEAVDRLRRAVRLTYRESASLRSEHLSQIKGMEVQRRDYFAQILQRGVDSGEFRSTDCSFLATSFLMLAAMWALKRYALPAELDIDSYAARQIEVIVSQLKPGVSPVPVKEPDLLTGFTLHASELYAGLED
jgi:TetR/AcrR family transcriptional regulator, cholesterol catabolism regulator